MVSWQTLFLIALVAFIGFLALVALAIIFRAHRLAGSSLVPLTADVLTATNLAGAVAYFPLFSLGVIPDDPRLFVSCWAVLVVALIVRVGDAGAKAARRRSGSRTTNP